MLIYKATNLINGNIYIGQTICPLYVRKNSHVQASRARRNQYYFHNALNKYGAENFVWEAMCECDSREKLNILEKFYITAYKKICNAKLYNMTDGGDAPVLSRESIKKIADKNRGKKRTPEQRQKISKRLMGNKNNLGKKRSIEVGEKISRSNKGKTYSADTIEKMRVAAKRRWEDGGYREKTISAQKGKEKERKNA